VRTALAVIGIVSIAFAAGLNLSYLLLWPFARRGLSREVRRRGWSWYEEVFASPLTPGVSIVVPAWNEERVVLEAMESFLAQRYPEFEIVIVDDGSSDDTARVIVEKHGLTAVAPAPRNRVPYEPVFEQYRSAGAHEITLVRKANGGRADAVNCGVDFARHPYVLVTDADSILDPDAITVMARPVLEDPTRVVAVGGTIRVANSCTVDAGRITEVRLPSGRLAAFQVVEYLRAFLFGRLGWGSMGGLISVSGAFGLFRRDVLEEVGGFWKDTVGEDLEMTIRLHHHMRQSGRPYRITFAPDPVCWTEVPGDIVHLGRQRRRGHRGLWEALWRHRGMMGRPRYGVTGIIALPYCLLFEFCGPLVEGAAWVAFPIGLALGVIDPWICAAFVLVSWLLGTLVTVVACELEETGYSNYRRSGDLPRMLMLSATENLGFRQLIDLYRIAGVWDLIRRKRHWGAMHRRGFSAA